MTAFHATNGPPFGWSSNRFTHCYRSVVPALKLTDTPSSARRILSKKLYTKQLCDDLAKWESARDAIQQQRVCIKLFTGNRSFNRRSVKETTKRLSGNHGNKIYPPGTKDLLPSLSSVPATPKPKYSPQDIQDIVDRLSTYDPEKIPESKGYAIKVETPVIYKKKYTRIELDDIVDRLMEYNPNKFPGESKGVAPIILHELPRQTLGRPRKCSSKEVQDLVDRLCEKDPGKWPTENRQRMVNAFKTVFENKKEVTPRSARQSTRDSTPRII